MRRGTAARARAGGGAASPRAFAVAAVVVALGCAGGGSRREPPEPDLRIWMPGLVHWDRGPRALALGIENGTNRTVQVEAPDPRRARVVLFLGSGPDRVCGQDGDDAAPRADAVSLAPGEVREVRVDLDRACAGLPPGEYRFEVSYDAPAAGRGPSVRLRPRYGHVVVEASGPLAPADRGGLGSGGSERSGDPEGGNHRLRR